MSNSMFTWKRHRGYDCSTQGDPPSDRFATTDINQARALATILNEWFGN